MVDVLYFVRERLKNRTAIVSHVSQGRLSTTLTYSDSRQMAAAWGKADWELEEGAQSTVGLVGVRLLSLGP